MNSTTGYSNRCNGITMSVRHSYSPFPSKGDLSVCMDVGYDDPIHSQQRQLRTKLQRSLLVKHNIETKMRFHQLQREHQTKILDIVSSILHITAASYSDQRKQGSCNNECSFLSPTNMRPKPKVSMASGLSNLLLSLDDDSEEEDQEASTFATAVDTSESSSSPPNETSQRKRVHWCERTSIQFTISRADITEEEKRKYWLQDEEFALIRLRDGYLGTLAEQQQRQIAAAAAAAAAAVSSETIPLFSSYVPISSKHWICARGLEFKMKLGFLRIKSNRLEVMENVLVEQERQWDEHWDEGRNIDTSPFCYDDEAMAAVCSDITGDCNIRAQRVAANDRNEAEDIFDEPNHDYDHSESKE